MIWIETGTGAGEPVTVAEAKAFLRLERGDEDALLATLIAAAREAVETETGLVLREARHRIAFEPGAGTRRVALSRRPVRAVLEATAFDAAGEPRAIDPAGIAVLNEPLGSVLVLPEVNAANGVEIELETGIAAGDLPDSLRLAILRLVAASYEMRGAVAPAMQPAFVPPLVRGLLAPFRAVRV
ncbi:phage head-tail connector protein [Aureimonas sp. AU12]|uniref:head-tail connector protein n=1 Tax=Aureimonas sp. AU12 TaxID=1638161 RepID=UPI0012E3D090|nr:phage head-tail connector protein [Aureimonas sp. AU12]